MQNGSACWAARQPFWRNQCKSDRVLPERAHVAINCCRQEHPVVTSEIQQHHMGCGDRLAEAQKIRSVAKTFSSPTASSALIKNCTSGVPLYSFRIYLKSSRKKWCTHKINLWWSAEGRNIYPTDGSSPVTVKVTNGHQQDVVLPLKQQWQLYSSKQIKHRSLFLSCVLSNTIRHHHHTI